MAKLTCPKCGNDTFKISMTERQEIIERIPQQRKLTIINILNITCSKCGWNRHFRRP